MIPTFDDDDCEIISNINLLNTIKVPMNLHNLQEELPKSNYDKVSFKSTTE